MKYFRTFKAHFCCSCTEDGYECCGEDHHCPGEWAIDNPHDMHYAELQEYRIVKTTTPGED